MTAFAHHFFFEFKTGIRNKQLLLMNYLFPLGFYLMMGFIFPQINPPFLENLIPAMVIFAVLASPVLGMPDPLVSARESGIFRSYKINGVPSTSILAVPAITTFVHLALVAAIIAFTAPWLFEAPTPLHWPGFILVFVATALACIGLGALIGVIAPSTRMTVLFSQLIFLPSMLLGGLMMPHSILPDSVARVSLLLPTTHAMNALDALAMGRPAAFDPWAGLVVLAACAVLALGLAVYLFNWDRHNAAQRGHPAMAALALAPFVVSVFVLG